MPEHAHDLTSIALVIEGPYLETIGRHTQECNRNTIQILPAGESHSFDFGRERVHCLTIDVKPQRLEALRPFSKLLDQTIQVQEMRLPAVAARVLNEMLLKNSSSLLFIEGLVLELLGDAERTKMHSAPSSQPRWLCLVRDLIQARFAEKISLVDIATSVGVHPTHLAQTFRRHFKCSVGEYVRLLRLEHAAQELLRSDTPVAEVALSAGFYDQSHFSRAFKLYTGRTPAEFRAAGKLIRYKEHSFLQ